MPKATRYNSMETYNGVLSLIKSPNPLVKWSFETTWQTKNISSTRVPIAGKLERNVQLEGLGWRTFEKGGLGNIGVAS